MRSVYLVTLSLFDFWLFRLLIIYYPNVLNREIINRPFFENVMINVASSNIKLDWTKYVTRHEMFILNYLNVIMLNQTIMFIIHFIVQSNV